MSRLVRHFEARGGDRLRSAHRRPRGPESQRARRESEREARRSVVAFARWAERQGVEPAGAARRIAVRPRTLEDWRQGWAKERLALRPRGRPTKSLGIAARACVLAVLWHCGPRMGLPALRGLFPEAPRGELAEIRALYRLACWVMGKWYDVPALRWRGPGAVWATDFADPPLPVDGVYRHILLVRDLASGDEILALPVLAEDAATARAALERLFLEHGPPLVLKSDNGSAFIEKGFEASLAAKGVTHLLSPARRPSYNGSCEAGNGSIETRAHHESARNDRPGRWTSDDVEAARRQANETARPWGFRGPTPEERFRARHPLGDDRRAAFRASCARNVDDLRRQWEARDGAPLDDVARAWVQRIAIGLALVEHGLLRFRRRRIRLPFSRHTARKIP